MSLDNSQFYAGIRNTKIFGPEPNQNGPVVSYKLSPEELAKYRKIEKDGEDMSNKKTRLRAKYPDLESLMADVDKCGSIAEWRRQNKLSSDSYFYALQDELAKKAIADAEMEKPEPQESPEPPEEVKVNGKWTPTKEFLIQCRDSGAAKEKIIEAYGYSPEELEALLLEYGIVWPENPEPTEPTLEPGKFIVVDKEDTREFGTEHEAVKYIADNYTQSQIIAKQVKLLQDIPFEFVVTVNTATKRAS